MKAHLGEDEELLWDMATDMEPEDGCLWIHGTDEYLRRCSRSTNVTGQPRGLERMVTFFFRDIPSNFALAKIAFPFVVEFITRIAFFAAHTHFSP